MSSISRFARVIVGLALVAATAALFGPQERWWGVDVGATGAALFIFTLWGGAWLFARYPDRIFPAEWSITERRAWAGLLFVALIFLNYLRFMQAIAHSDDTPTFLHELPARYFVWKLFALLIAWAVVAKTIRGAQDELVELDERDRLKRHSAVRAGNRALTFIVIVCVALLAALPAVVLDWWLAPLIAANALIGILILKSCAEHACLVAAYIRERR